MGIQMVDLVENLERATLFLFEETGRDAIGTAFLVQVPVPSAPEHVVPVVVTAKHVIGDAKRIVGRFSAKGLATTAIHQYNLENMRAEGDLWEHPDEGVDVVVFRTQHLDLADYLGLTVESIARKDFFQKREIIPTHQVIFPSLLVNFYGKTRNYPVFRMGSIAAVPEEPIPFEFRVGSRLIRSQQPLILIDATAVPGASGSPVYFWPTARVQGFTFLPGGGNAPLIGVMHGFYPAPPRETETLPSMAGPQAFRENSRIAIAVPSWRLSEILEQPSVSARADQLWHDSKR